MERMPRTEDFFPVRYERSRPFLKRFYTLTRNVPSAELFSAAFQMKIQNMLYDEMVSEEVNHPPELLGDQKRFELKLSRELNFYWFYHSWLTNGRNIFHFTKEILEMFDKTDVSQVPLSSIQFPFDSFYISFVDLDRLYGVDTTGREIYTDGIMVVKDLYKPKQLDFFLCSLVKNTKPDKQWLTNKYASLFGDWFRVNYTNDSDTIDDTGFIPKFLQDKNDEDLTAGTRIFFTSIINLIINSLCYISSDQESVKAEWPGDTPQLILNRLQKSNSKKQSEEIKEQLKSLGFSKVTFLGRDYKSHGPSVETGNTLSAHWRRGHWRHQPHGHGLTERKLVWIKPTIVNKDKGEPEKGKIYEVE
jgi:hypothetical protein